MKAYQVVENGKPLEEKELDTPEPKGKEILLKTVACGVCHSDVHIHDGYFDLGGGVQLPSPLPEGKPLTMGHEIFGEVVATGEDVEGINIGEKVIIGGGSMVIKDIPNNTMNYGIPSKIIKKNII